MAAIYPITELMLIWLLAHNAGLAACGIVVPPYVGQQICEELGIEGRDIIVGISLGYPDEQPVAEEHPRAKATYYG
ncbi:MAG: nitroreductase family protein [Candidatus Aquicultor sp.]